MGNDDKPGGSTPAQKLAPLSAAQFVFAPPTPFDFKVPSSWERWAQRFERYRDVSGLSELSSGRQVTTLMYCMGEDAEDILTASKLTDDEKQSYSAVKKMFTEFFIGKRNVIYERAKFNTRVQTEGETVESFATDLRKLGEHCNYEKFLDEFIRDRIVIGIRDLQLSEALQLDADLTLEKALLKCRQKESVRRQQTDLQNSGIVQKSHVDAVNRNRHPSKPKPSSSSNEQCWNCGQSKHPKEQCPAKDAVCHKCKNVGHYANKCRKKSGGGSKPNRPSSKISEVQGYSSSDDFAYLGSIDVVTKTNDVKPINGSVREVNGSFFMVFRVNEKPVDFKLDSGAHVTAIPPEMKPPNQQLLPSDLALRAAARNELDVVGMFEGTIKSRTKQIEEKIYVVKNLEAPLLGAPALKRFKLIQFNNIDEVKSSGPYAEKIHCQYPELFRPHGTLSGKYHIELESSAVPFSLKVARNVAIPLRNKVHEELKRIEGLDIISKISEPTDWCAPMVTVSKANGSVRLCVDLSHLNQYVKWSRLILPDVEHTLGIIGQSCIFTKLDAASGYWQIKLDEESAKLTTFITPFGRYYFKRLPFGISSAPEIFQLRMQELLKGLDGVVCHMDDILIHGYTQQEHDNRLFAVLDRLKGEGLVLNSEKCVFSVNQVKFLGQIIDHENVRPDPERVKALAEFPDPKDVSEVRRFCGLVNQLSKFIPNLANKTQPIRELLRKDIVFQWGPDQRAAIKLITNEIQQEISLLRYDLNAEISLSADASQFGLGAVLFQRSTNQQIKPISFASRTLSDTEQRYAQIEKEALAITWACEKFDMFLRGRDFEIETDHKPLVPLLSTKSLLDIPPRIQRFKMRLMKYRYKIRHSPGKNLYTADCLSRAPLINSEDSDFTNQVEAYVDAVTKIFPATPSRLTQILNAQKADDECRELHRLIKNGWPDFNNKVPESVRQWFPHRGELTVVNGLICRGTRLVIPKTMRAEMLSRIHDGHQGVVRCLERAKSSVFWPGISAEINRLVERCETCSKHRSAPTYPMIPTTTPPGPWVKVAIDYFEIKRFRYIVMIDYYSRYIELAKVSTLTVKELITKCKAIFARHGIPQEVFSDSGTQFTSAEFQAFGKDYGFKVSTSSPHYHQSNGEAERAVKTVKQLLTKNSEDPFLALLSYRATPNSSGLSPAELLMGRKLRTRLPTLPGNTQPQFIDHDDFVSKDTSYRRQQAENYDRRHRVTPTKTFVKGERVYIPDRKSEGTVVENADAPRSVIVKTPEGTVRRNSTMLRQLSPSEPAPPEQPEPRLSPPVPSSAVSPIKSPSQRTSTASSSSGSPEYHPPPATRSGRPVRIPDRF